MTQVKYVTQRQARLARAMMGHNINHGRPERRSLTSDEKRIARHMAHVGATVKDIAQAINWTLSTNSLYEKLRKVNIKTKRSLTNYLHRD